MVMFRVCVLFLCCLTVLGAGCSSPADSTQTETVPSTSESPATPAETPTETTERATFAPGDRIYINATTDAPVTVARYEYQAGGMPPDSVTTDAANWTRGATETFTDTPGEFRVTAFEPDGHYAILRNGTVVYTGGSGPYHQVTIRVPDSGKAEVVDFLAL